MPETVTSAVAVIGIDIGKNSFHVVGLNQRGAIVLRQRWSRGPDGDTVRYGGVRRRSSPVGGSRRSVTMPA
jgi:hypothetical protein